MATLYLVEQPDLSAGEKPTKTTLFFIFCRRVCTDHQTLRAKKDVHPTSAPQTFWDPTHIFCARVHGNFGGNFLIAVFAYKSFIYALNHTKFEK